MQLTVLTYNTLFGGRDGDNSQREQAQIRLIGEIRPDVFLMQEAKGFDASGGALLHRMEALVSMRGFLAVAPRTGQNVAIFIREPLRPTSFESESAHFHHTFAKLKVMLPGAENAFTLISTHLCPNGAAVRRREAAYLTVHAASDHFTLLTGDFNSVSPHDPEPEDFGQLPAHHRARYLSEDLCTADRSVLAQLEAAGWVDVGHALGGAGIPTAPTKGFTGTEFAMMRCDYILASKPLAACATSYKVLRTPAADTASDHYPVVATFEVPR